MESTNFDIYHDLIIKATAREVFNKITSPEHLVNWWPLRCSGRRESGATYNFYFSPEYNWYGKVVTCNPNAAFHIKMTKADAGWNNTTLAFDLEENGDMIIVKFAHTCFQECNHHFRRTSFCWAILLNNLKKYIEKGIVVPFEERQ